MQPEVLHVLPAGDVIQHVTSGDCLCGPSMRFVTAPDSPSVTYGWIYVHHSLDGRESREEGNAEQAAT